MTSENNKPTSVLLASLLIASIFAATIHVYAQSTSLDSLETMQYGGEPKPPPQPEPPPPKTEPPKTEPTQPEGGGGCLIATAAFGSELTPQVQFLRSYRDNHILSTAAGSSFMKVFNAWYYSFSPYVADYERKQPLVQEIVKGSIYPLLDILYISENAYSSIDGEYGALASGLIASSMIGALYFWPFPLAVKRLRESKLNYTLFVFILAAVSVAVVGSIISGNISALMVSTSLFVLTILAISAIVSAKMIVEVARKLDVTFRT